MFISFFYQQAQKSIGLLAYTGKSRKKELIFSSWQKYFIKLFYFPREGTQAPKVIKCLKTWFKVFIQKTNDS